LAEFISFSSFHPSCASRASELTAASSLVAFEVSWVFVVVEEEGCLLAAALGLPSPKEPEFFRDSPARESDVTVPTASLMAFFDSGPVVTWEW
jgi:hypothetical protein